MEGKGEILMSLNFLAFPLTNRIVMALAGVLKKRVQIGILLESRGAQPLLRGPLGLLGSIGLNVFAVWNI